MISEQELGQKLDAIKEELERALDRASEPQIQESIGRAEAIVEELRATLPVPAKVPDKKKHSIMEWWGVGADFWRQMNVDEYIRKERDSWR